MEGFIFEFERREFIGSYISLRISGRWKPFIEFDGFILFLFMLLLWKIICGLGGLTGCDEFGVIELDLVTKEFIVDWTFCGRNKLFKREGKWSSSESELESRISITSCSFVFFGALNEESESDSLDMDWMSDYFFILL